MKRKFHTPEQIIKKLREADAIMAQGGTVDQACRKLEISDATYYNWRKQAAQNLKKSRLTPDINQILEEDKSKYISMIFTKIHCPY